MLLVYNMSTDRLTGMVKWFNNKSGYGFISTLDDDKKDIFVHYTSIRGYDPENKANFVYKYLVQGEYVEFVLTKTEDEKHEVKADDVTGIRAGPLMCDTQHENSRSRAPPRRR